VTINTGETVTFSSPTGSNFHNVVFESAQPTSCTLAGGTPGPAPMPPDPSGDPWSGTCVFNAAGAYDFVCGAHDTMRGTVTVEGSTTTPAPTTTATATATASVAPAATAAPQPTTAPAPSGGGSDAPFSSPVGPAATRPVIARSQRGHAVRGSISIARAGSRVRVELLARPSALGRRGSKQIKVGSSTKPAGAGTARFTVKLSSAAKKAVRRKRKLALTVKITVTPASGDPFTATSAVVVRR
jgi:hypothetical protein